MGILHHRRKPCLRLAPVRTPSGAVIGEIVQDGAARIFTRRVREERDLYRSLDAWPLGAFALEQLRRWRVATIRYTAQDGVYETTVADFLARAIPLEFAHETQFVLPRAWWATRSARPAGRAAGEQLGLALGSTS